MFIKHVTIGVIYMYEIAYMYISYFIPMYYIPI